MMSATEERLAPDLLLAVGFAIVTQVEVWVFAADDGYSLLVRVAAAVLTAIASLALAGRRRRPVASYFANGVAIYALIAIGYASDIYQWTNLIAVYSVAAYASRRASLIGLLAGVLGVSLYFGRFPSEGGVISAAFVVSLWVVGWLGGRMYGARIEGLRLRAENERALAVARTQEERLRLEQERARIAREVHDIVGHAVNVMVLHAGAGRGRSDDPHAAEAAFRTIEDTGRSALEEIDRLLAVLRRDGEDPDLRPPAGVADLPGLGASVEPAGLAVNVAIRGDASRVPDGVSLAAYRIVQEALTNVVKHAAATSAAVEVEIDPGRLGLVVRDDGVGVGAGAGRGRGIVGMRERAEMHGGALELGTAADGGCEVRAHLAWTVAG